MSSKNTSPLLSVRPRSLLASRPFFFVERILGSNAWSAPRVQGYGSQLLISLEWFHAAVPTTIRCEAVQANRWLKCQPSSYVRLEAYGFFGLSEGA